MSSTRLTSTSCSLCRYLQLALEVLALGAVRGGADDRPAAAEVEFGGLAAQALALFVLQAPGDADALAGGGVDHVAAGDRQLHRQARALGLQGVLDDLHDDLLAGLEQLGDLVPAAASAPADVHAGEHDLIDVQKAVLLQADVDERGLQAGQDVVDLALVDVAHDRAPAAALDVQLSYPIAGPRFAAAFGAGRGTRRTSRRPAFRSPPAARRASPRGRR